MNVAERAAGSAGPTVSVVIPVRDGADTIEEQLAALEAQTFTGDWEVVVADNGSTDGTPDLVRSWTGRLPGLRVVAADGRSCAAHARNVGAGAARGAVLLFCDADDVVSSRWLASLAGSMTDAEMAAGPIESERLNGELLRRWRPPLPDRSLPTSHGFLPYALGANLAIRASAFDELGGFREDYTVGEDVELTWRGQLQGMRLAFVPDAVVHYRYRPGLLTLLRQYLAYGTIGPRLYRDFRQAGMPPSRPRQVIGPWVRLIARLPLALLRRHARGDVLRRIAYRTGRIRGSVETGVIYL